MMNNIYIWKSILFDMKNKFINNFLFKFFKESIKAFLLNAIKIRKYN